jgi:dolichyl-phosphate mannosyltransferase polypeptide 2 regulatory subunit
LDKLVGLAMLVAASVVFLYYTAWTLLLVSFAFDLPP